MRREFQLLAGVAAVAMMATTAQAAPMSNQSQSTAASQSRSMSHTDPSAAGSGVNTQAPNQASADYSLINLSDRQQKQLFQAASDLPKQSLQQQIPGSPVIAGSKLPNGVQLSAIPSDVKANSSKLKNLKLAKLQNGDVLVVDPSNNTVQDVIVPSDVSQTGKSPSASQSTNASGGVAPQSQGSMSSHQ